MVGHGAAIPAGLSARTFFRPPLGRPDHPLCRRARARAVAIAIFQLVDGSARDAAKMHYRSTRRRWTCPTRNNLDECCSDERQRRRPPQQRRHMTTLQTISAAAAAAAAPSQPASYGRPCWAAAALFLFYSMPATCTHFNSWRWLARVIQYPTAGNNVT